MRRGYLEHGIRVHGYVRLYSRAGVDSGGVWRVGAQRTRLRINSTLRRQWKCQGASWESCSSRAQQADRNQMALDPTACGRTLQHSGPQICTLRKYVCWHVHHQATRIWSLQEPSWNLVGKVTKRIHRSRRGLCAKEAKEALETYADF